MLTKKKHSVFCDAYIPRNQGLNIKFLPVRKLITRGLVKPVCVRDVTNVYWFSYTSADTNFLSKATGHLLHMHQR